MIKQILIFLSIAIWLSSCGGSEGDSSTTNGKKVIKYNQTGGLTSLDPAFAGQRSNIWATSQLYNGLFNFSKNLDVHPELVKEYNASEDGLTYTFTIRKGVYFHDNVAFSGGRGREVVAADFVYSFKRIIDPEVASPGAWIFNDKVLLGADGKPSDTCFVADPENPYKFRIYLQRRFPAFLQILAMPYCYVVPKEVVEKYRKDFRSNPVGTGPFKLKNWDEKNSLVMLKNEKYWKKDSEENALPYADAVEISFVDDRNQEFRMFKSGEIDFITNIAESSKDEILEKNGQVKEAFNKKYVVNKIDYLNTEYIGFLLEGSEDDNPFINQKLRQALSYAINRKGLLSYLRNGAGAPANSGMVPKALPSFDSTKVKGYPYSPKKAQKLLKEAGYPGGKGLPKLTLSTYKSDKDIAEYLKKNWEDIGVKVDIDISEFSAHKQKVDQGKVKMFRGSWLGDYPDAENYLALFYSKNLSPMGPNKTHFKNDEFDRLFEEAHKTDNLFVRFEDYLKMDAIVMEYAPAIPLYYDEIIQVHQKRIKGLEVDAMNNLRLEFVKVKE